MQFHCFLSPYFCGWESTYMIFAECSKSNLAREFKDFEFVPKATQKIQLFPKEPTLKCSKSDLGNNFLSSKQPKESTLKCSKSDPENIFPEAT